jgi:hypothetical protein
MSHCVTSGLVTKQYITRATMKMNMIIPQCDTQPSMAVGPTMQGQEQQLQHIAGTGPPLSVANNGLCQRNNSYVFADSASSITETADYDGCRDLSNSSSSRSLNNGNEVLTKHVGASPAMFARGSPIVRPSILAARLRFSPGAPCTAATGGAHVSVCFSPQVLPLLQRRGHRVVSWYPPPAAVVACDNNPTPAAPSVP